MYAVTYNDTVFLTPTTWSPRYIASVIEDDYEVQVTILPSDVTNVPYNVTPEIRILPLVEDRPVINDLTEMFTGPSYTVTPELVTATYGKQYQPLDLVKTRVKQEVMKQRYDKEVFGIPVTIQGQEVWVETDRDTRNLFFQAYLLTGETETRNWKFGEIFIELTKADLELIVGSGAMYVQSMFNWESGYNDQIDSADYSGLELIWEELKAVNEEPIEGE